MPGRRSLFRGVPTLFRPTQAICPRCEVMRPVVLHPDPAGSVVVAAPAYVVADHAGEPGGTQCLGSGSRVIYPHEVLFPQEVRAV